MSGARDKSSQIKVLIVAKVESTFMTLACNLREVNFTVS